MPRLALLPLTLLLALLAAPAAHAAESFLGLATDGRVVRFTDESVPATSTPRALTGLAAGDRVVAFAGGVALGSSGRLYRLDARTRTLTATPARITGEGRSWSLIPDRDRVRVLNEQRLDVTADLATGALTPGTALRLAGGEPVRAAVSRLPDGRLVGVDLDRRTLVTETAPGSGVVSATPLRTERRVAPSIDVRAPVTFVLAGGSGWLVDRYGAESRAGAQSRMLRIDLATGATQNESGPYFFQQLVSVLPTGTVADDRDAPRTRLLDAPRTVSIRALRREGGVRLRVSCSEGCSVFASTAVGGRPNQSNFATRATPGRLTVALPRHDAQELRLMRRSPSRLNFRLSSRDFAGNVTTITRRFRLVP